MIDNHKYIHDLGSGSRSFRKSVAAQFIFLYIDKFYENCRCQSLAAGDISLSRPLSDQLVGVLTFLRFRVAAEIVGPYYKSHL